MDTASFFSLCVTGLLASFALGFLTAGKRGSAAAREQGDPDRVSELEKSVGALMEENRKYALLDRKITDAIRFLSLNLSYEEVVSEISRLIREIVPAGFIGLYLHDEIGGCLKLSSSVGDASRAKKLYLPGDGAIGSSAKNKVLISKESVLQPTNGGPSTRTLDVSVPILFNDELLGVIHLGNIENPDGNEKKVLAMVASLSGMLLRNSRYFDYARHEANTDQLTGIYNRRFFFGRAAEELVRAKAYAYPLSIFMFDIDNFKNYNDSNGHVAGDALLRELCDIVKQITRKTSLLARYGGEEFIVLLPNIDKENAVLYAERVRKLVEKHPFPFSEKQPKGFVSISGGTASYPSDCETIDDLLNMADTALYFSKRDGKNRVTAYRKEFEDVLVAVDAAH